VSPEQQRAPLVEAGAGLKASRILLASGGDPKLGSCDANKRGLVQVQASSKSTAFATAATLVFAIGCGGQTHSEGDAGGDDASADAPGDVGDDVVVFNGCTAANYVDRSAPTAMRVVTVGVSYIPRCMSIKVGQQVVFKGDVATHSMETDDLSGPFAGYATVGDEAFVNFPEAGYFAYFDQSNKSSTGVVRVVP